MVGREQWLSCCGNCSGRRHGWRQLAAPQCLTELLSTKLSVLSSQEPEYNPLVGDDEDEDLAMPDAAGALQSLPLHFPDPNV